MKQKELGVGDLGRSVDRSPDPPPPHRALSSYKSVVARSLEIDCDELYLVTEMFSKDKDTL